MLYGRSLIASCRAAGFHTPLVPCFELRQSESVLQDDIYTAKPATETEFSIAFKLELGTKWNQVEPCASHDPWHPVWRRSLARQRTTKALGL